MTKRKRFGISKSLSEGLSYTINAAQENAGSLRFEIVPLSKIELDPDNPRELSLSLEDLPQGPLPNDPEFAAKKADLQSLESLAHTIKRQGVLNPIWIYKHHERYRVVAGERRVLASVISQQEGIPAKILDQKPEGSDLRILQWVENIERADLSLKEKINNLSTIIEEYKKQSSSEIEVNATFIKNLLGCSLPHAMNYHAVVFASNDIKNAINSAEINSLEKAAAIANIRQPDLRAKALAACVSGESLKAVQSYLSEDKAVTLSKKDDIVSRKISRGRPAAKIKLGQTVNPKVPQLFAEIILADPRFRAHLAHFESINWNDFAQATSAFTRLVKLVEEAV